MKPENYADLARLPDNMSDEVLDANYNEVTRRNYGGIAPVDEVTGLVGTPEDRDRFYDAEIHRDPHVVSMALGGLREEALRKRAERENKS